MQLTLGAGDALPPGTTVLIYERPGSRPVLKPPFEIASSSRKDILVGGGRTTGTYGRTSRVRTVYFVVARTRSGELYYSRVPAGTSGGYDRGFMVLQSGRVEMGRIPSSLRPIYATLFTGNGASDSRGESVEASDNPVVVGAENLPPILRGLAPVAQMEILQYARRYAAAQVDSVRRAAYVDLSRATDAERQRAQRDARELERAENRAQQAERELESTHSTAAARVNPVNATVLALLLAALGFGLGSVLQRNRLGARAGKAESRVVALEKEAVTLRREGHRLSALLKEADAEEATMRASFLNTTAALDSAQKELEHAQARHAEAQRTAREASSSPPPGPSLTDEAATYDTSPRSKPRPSLRSLFAGTKMGSAKPPAPPPYPAQDLFDASLPDEPDEEAAYAAVEDEHDEAHEALGEAIGHAFAAWCREPGPRLPRYYMFERTLRAVIPEAEVHPLFLTDEDRLQRNAAGGSEYWAVEANGATFAVPAPRSARGFRGLAPVFEETEVTKPLDVARAVPARLSATGSAFEVVSRGRLEA